MEDLNLQLEKLLLKQFRATMASKDFRSANKYEIKAELLELINQEVVKARIELIKKLDNSVPNFWKTNQKEYTHQDMQDLLDLMAQELADTESNKEGVEV